MYIASSRLHVHMYVYITSENYTHLWGRGGLHLTAHFGYIIIMIERKATKNCRYSKFNRYPKLFPTSLTHLRSHADPDMTSKSRHLTNLQWTCWPKHILSKLAKLEISSGKARLMGKESLVRKIAQVKRLNGMRFFIWRTLFELRHFSGPVWGVSALWPCATYSHSA